MNRPNLFLYLIIICATVFTRCNKEKINERKLEKMLIDIKALAASSVCDNNGTYQLKYIKYGKRECAGAGYLAYSTSIDISNLENQVKKYNELESAYLEKKNDGIDCHGHTLPPKSVACENGKLKLVY